MLVHHRTGSLERAIRGHQLPDSTFGATCCALRKAQLLASPPDALIASKAAEVRAAAKAIKAGPLQGRLVRKFEI
jgi:hypothetical protein